VNFLPRINNMDNKEIFEKHNCKYTAYKNKEYFSFSTERWIRM
jgi:hypothetical protein